MNIFFKYFFKCTEKEKYFFYDILICYLTVGVLSEKYFLTLILLLHSLQPFWTYTAKLMESLYHISASSANFYVGTFGLTASALGILVAGIVISKFQPTARVLTLWNVVIGVISALAVLSFAFMGCSQNDNSVKMNFNAVCNADCHCDFVKYSPVCGIDSFTYTRYVRFFKSLKIFGYFYFYGEYYISHKFIFS